MIANKNKRDVFYKKELTLRDIVVKASICCGLVFKRLIRTICLSTHKTGECHMFCKYEYKQNYI